MPFLNSTLANNFGRRTPLLLCLLCCAIAAAAGAQGRTPAPAPPVVPDSSAAPRAIPAPAPRTPTANHIRPRAPEPTAGRTLRLAPQGRWWDDGMYSRNLAIDARQQRRMDQVFGSNRDQLLKLYNNLKHEESTLEGMGKNANESELDRQIDKVAQARTELQKADTHLLIEIRKQLTPEQLAKLDAVSQ